MRTCANVAHGLGRGGGYEPLPEAGEWVCDCYEHGTGEPWAHVGSRHVHERVVRCRDCRHYAEHEWVVATDVADVCHFWHGEPTKVEPDGFCAWGERRAQ